ncbi:MAG TPA: hypothetical protein VNA11_14190, partial [Pseudonocardia sp.]|nr:hypothetical protein [Pseudonocardia sp.]
AGRSARSGPAPASALTALPAPHRPARPAGPDRYAPDPGPPGWSDRDGAEPVEFDDRVLYRRPDALPLRPGGARPAPSELVDGETVYRIYRPGARRTVYTPSRGAG